MTLKKIVNRAYPIIVMTVFLSIFSMIVSKFFIPKTILMSGEFPYPTEEYTPKKSRCCYSVDVAFICALLYVL